MNIYFTIIISSEGDVPVPDSNSTLAEFNYDEGYDLIHESTINASIETLWKVWTPGNIHISYKS